MEKCKRQICQKANFLVTLQIESILPAEEVLTQKSHGNIGKIYFIQHY